MHLHHQLQSAFSPTFAFIKKIGKKGGFISSDSLRVIAYHDIPHNQKESLIVQLNWIKTQWNILSPAQFESMILGDEPIIGDNILITFDDGFMSNRIVADEILKPMGIKAIFFVVSDFVDIKSHKKARLFVANNIIPNSNIENIPKNLVNMQWKDLEFLIEQGHTIGSHTKKHVRLNSSISDSDLQEEIIMSAELISSRLGINIEHFAYTFGDIESFSPVALKIAKKRYQFVYSGIRGDNSKSLSQFAIRRDPAAFQLQNNEYQIFNNKLLSSFLGGFADFKYRNSRRIIDDWSQR
jgi:peptidoglycan/xylan/chitin deacetylase (PgdA/CDA1 family)